MRPKIDRPVIVEGKYDKLRLLSIFDAVVLTTDGFGVFRSEEKKLLIRTLAAKRGVLVLTDPDGAGLVIRNFLRGILPSKQITHLYIPPVPGVEKRKRAPSREGLLGVEGMEKTLLQQLFSPYICGNGTPQVGEKVSKTDFFCDGFSGGKNSKGKRAALSSMLHLPQNLSANALLEAINLITDQNGYRAVVDKLKQAEQTNPPTDAH